MAPLEPWEKVLVNSEGFLAEVHGQIACQACHEGVNSPDKDTAHTGLVIDPSAPPANVCDRCHYETASSGEGLHASQAGYWSTLETRGASKPAHDPDRIDTLLATYNQHCGSCHTQCGECHYFPPNTEDVVVVKEQVVQEKKSRVDHLAEIEAMRAAPKQAAIQSMFNNHCSSCHTSCGDCHISQPSPVGGGFVEGHVVMKTPSMTRNCTACHGSRVGNEYLGKHEGIAGDVHFREERMNCVDCHPGSEMHDVGQRCEECHKPEEGIERIQAGNRYAGEQTPACETCHPEMGAWNDTNQNHQIHKGLLACQVCHSVSYTSCDGCHVAVSDKTGNPFFESEGDYLSFFIGRNSSPDYHRPYEYVVLRHIPAAVDAYDYYGNDLQPQFGSLPTWMYATPHNIQKETPQNESCNACHGNPDLFLTLGKLKPGEVNANLNVIVDQIPGVVDEP